METATEMVERMVNKIGDEYTALLKKEHKRYLNHMSELEKKIEEHLKRLQKIVEKRKRRDTLVIIMGILFLSSIGMIGMFLIFQIYFNGG